MTKDWTGNSNSIYKTLGASNHTDKERQNEDYYATDPKAADFLENFITKTIFVYHLQCSLFDKLFAIRDILLHFFHNNRVRYIPNYSLYFSI